MNARSRPVSYAERFVDDIFPSRYKRGALPGERYTSAGFFAREWENVWTKVWLVIARATEIPEAGDFVVEDIGPESILVVRQEDGGIKAFYNVCQHRGNRLVQPAQGSPATTTAGPGASTAASCRCRTRAISPKAARAARCGWRR